MQTQEHIFPGDAYVATRTFSWLCLLISPGSCSLTVWVCLPAVLFGKLYGWPSSCLLPGLGNYRLLACLGSVSADLTPTEPCIRSGLFQPALGSLGTTVTALGKRSGLAAPWKELAFRSNGSIHQGDLLQSPCLPGARGEISWLEGCLQLCHAGLCLHFRRLDTLYP